jgi:hypothetical protein
MATASTHNIWTMNPAAETGSAHVGCRGVDAFKPAGAVIGADARGSGTAFTARTSNVQALATRCDP